MAGGNRLPKLKEKLAEYSNSIDEFDRRSSDARAAILIEKARYENLEKDVSSIDRKIKLIEAVYPFSC